ncbi:MAG: trypsin-like peptidase domain-containing protein [Butyrivibrio sp.]|nr:trypsin-like peptidase domain-containing protein [Butyrivibrio sp.]
MYEDERNEVNEKTYNSNTANNGSNQTVDLGQWAANNNNQKSTNTYRSYNYSGTGNGAYSGSNPYSTGNTGYSNNTYGQNTYNNSGYSYGQNNYSYNQAKGTQPVYGNYQYSTGNGGVTPPVKKKKNILGRVAAIVAVAALITGGVYGAYKTIGNHITFKSEHYTITQQDQSEKTDPEVIENETTEQQASANADKEIKTTTVSGDSLAVVTDVTQVVNEVMPAMVMIHNNYTQSASYFGYSIDQEATASGSGIIVGKNDNELLVATNYHVIEGADTLEVIFTDDSTVEAVVKGTNSDMDLAVIAVMLDSIDSDTLDTIKIATLGDSDALTLGEPAIAIGNALGYGQSVTTGVISALNRSIEMEDGDSIGFIQTDAAINPGNSGGALLNVQGEVIGINSNKIGGDTVEGMGYAIPISVAKPIIEQLMNEQTRIKVASADRGYIGISGVSVTAEVTQGYGIPQGVYVAEITNGGGAEAAGLEKGDVIVGFDGSEITSMDDLQTRLQYYAAGTEVEVVVMRQMGQEYKEATYTVTLGPGSGTTGGADSNAAEGGGNGQFNGGQGSQGGH